MQKLKASFREFPERGTIEDFWELVPNTHKTAVLNTPHSMVPASSKITRFTDDNPSPKSLAQCATRQKSCLSTTKTASENTFMSSTCDSLPNPTTDSLFSTPVASIADDLVAQTKCNDRKRTQRLTRVIEALKSATALLSQSYETLWSGKERLFVGKEPGLEGWMCRLKCGCNKIDEGIGEFGSASRLSLVLIPQFVDYSEDWESLLLKSGGEAPVEGLPQSKTLLVSVKFRYNR